VLQTAELPAGPARAVLVAYQEGGARRFAVIVRSLRSGAAVAYELDAEDGGDEDAWTVALDASLSFGESMGFLFDDEMLVDRRRDTLRRGLAAVHEILAPPDVGADDEPEVDPGAPKIGSADELAEILLDEELDGMELVSGTSARAPAEPGLGPAPPQPEEKPAAPLRLSKFRAAPSDRRKPQPSAEPSPSAAPATEPSRKTPPDGEQSQPGRSRRLGRVKPVRVRVDGEAAAKVDPLVRLLADF
jgi:hypothetical protein